MNARASKTLLGAFFVGLVVLALSVSSGFAQQKIEGMVVALKITQCGMKPGSCKGLVEIGEPGKAHALQVEPATTTIKRAGKVVVLQELRLGDNVRAEFERMQDKDVARVIEAQKGSH
ncbi:MAG: hypothetical protein AUH81_17325 [Candidatus Rokubacteria bacterium 13_1_40CM_4_69_5]|nr:MAG: hypothetical protein AUH81_17325 [Candidatus Rokubacteria bacterium 13_1_40CM_4_69_5]